MAAKIRMKLRRHVQYGHSRYYPGDDLSHAILENMKERKTFTQREVEVFEKRGKVEIEIEELDECPEEK